MWVWRSAGSALVAIALAAVVHGREGNARGYPVMRDLDGRKLADGDFSQWTARDGLHVHIGYAFGRGRTIVEEATFRESPQLTARSWSWRETRDGALYRHFAVDFDRQQATAETHADGDHRYSETIDTNGERAFAGFGFSLAIATLRPQLLRGERATLKAIGFTPKPKVVDVEITHAGVDDLPMAGRLVRGDQFVVHPKIPWIAKPFVNAPDTHIWLANPAPAGFVRWEGPLAEPGDTVVRVDVLPGSTSGPARPVGTSGRGNGRER
ncbi:MAG TPA: hypothetical protein VKH42_17285 [Vicinamibacterales bacterium]|nr:hypothetical protein [Vicinamibacterales bacterium]